MTYVISSTRWALDAGAAKSVTTANARLCKHDGRVDEAMEATIVFEKDSASGEGSYAVPSTIYADMRRANVAFLVPRLWELPTITVELEEATVTFYNFMVGAISFPGLTILMGALRCLIFTTTSRSPRSRQGRRDMRSTTRARRGLAIMARTTGARTGGSWNASSTNCGDRRRLIG